MSKKITTPFEAAVDLIQVYVLRGDDFDQFRGGLLGSYNSDYSAQIGGYRWPMEYLKGEKNLEEVKGEKLSNTKILVEIVNNKPVNEVFDLRKVWDYILAQEHQKALF
jgi:hypothetical protein